MKNKTTYRVDSTFNNERLYIDVRDDISLMQALTADSSLKLDAYTMTYLISMLRSIILTAENIPDETIKITSQSLYDLKKKILNEEKKKNKLAKKELNKAASGEVPAVETKSLGHVEQELDILLEEEEEDFESEETEK